MIPIGSVRGPLTISGIEAFLSMGEKAVVMIKRATNVQGRM
ncbi:MAG TPA: hypothetical protein VIB79_17595 [Candidatus Binatia bacterium]